MIEELTKAESESEQEEEPVKNIIEAAEEANPDRPTYAQVNEFLKEHPKLDYLMAYTLLSMKDKDLSKYQKEVKPQEDFMEKSKVSIE